MYDLIIIGSGPAGLGAAIYGRRAGLDILVLEKNPMSGGQVLNTYEVDNYLGMPGINGFEMGMQFREHADRLGAAFLETDVTGISIDGAKRLVHTSREVLEAKAVIVATGAVHKKLEAPGEDRLAGRGISYCATCDGAFYRGKTVAVVGGGDVAAEDAIFLARSCRKVYLIHRRNELRAAKRLQEQLFAISNIETVWDTVVEEIQGDQAVSGVLVRNKKEQKQSVLEVDGVFIAVGITPDSGICRGVVEMDENGYLIAGEDCATSVPGIFAAGDVRTKKLRQIITAVADGANAVAAAQEYFLGG